MKTLELTLWGVPLTVTLWQQEKDYFDPQSGHYTVPDKWHIDTIEHEGIDITNIISVDAWLKIEKEANQ